MEIVSITTFRDGLLLLFAREILPSLFDIRGPHLFTTGFWTNLLELLNCKVRREIPRSDLDVLALLNVDRAVVFDSSAGCARTFAAASDIVEHLSGRCRFMRTVSRIDMLKHSRSAALDFITCRCRIHMRVLAVQYRVADWPP
jgi:hypothetical protein